MFVSIIGMRKMRKNDKLHAYWSKRENDLMLYSPLGFGTVPDARYIADILSKEVLKELDSRGYDTTTIKFSIEPKQGEIRFASQRPEGVTSEDAWELLKNGKAEKEA